MVETQNFSELKFPKRIPVYYALLFAVTILNAWLTLEFFKSISFSEIFSTFIKYRTCFSIAYIISILFLVILLIMTDRTNKQVLQLIPKKK